MTPSHKNRTALIFAICIGVLSLLALYFAATQSNTPTKEEIAAMEILPGYMFISEGNTNIITCSKSLRHFRTQQRLMPYLLLVADKFKVYDWPKEWPIRINETQNEVIITWPAEGEFLEERRFPWGAPYLLEVIIDKKTMKIVSAIRGG